MTESKKTLWELSKDILTILVIPAIVWIIKIETTNTTLILENEQRGKEISKLEGRLEELKALDARIQATALQEVRLEGKIDSAVDKLNEIRTLLNAK